VSITLGFAALFAVLGSALQVVDDAGNAVAGARADFVDARGAHAVVATGPTGEASPPPTFDAVAVDVTKTSFLAAHVKLVSGTLRVVLERTLPTIGSVAVATGSLQTLHQIAARCVVAGSRRDRARTGHVVGSTVARAARLRPRSQQQRLHELRPAARVILGRRQRPRRRTRRRRAGAGRLRRPNRLASLSRGSRRTRGVAARSGFRALRFGRRGRRARHQNLRPDRRPGLAAERPAVAGSGLELEPR